MVQIVHNFAEEINLLAETIPCGVGDTPQKRKYKYSLLNLLSQMEAMAVPLTSIYNLKTYIFSIYVMLGDRDTAVIWCRELARYCRIRQHRAAVTADIIICLVTTAGCPARCLARAARRPRAGATPRTGYTDTSQTSGSCRPWCRAGPSSYSDTSIIITDVPHLPDCPDRSDLAGGASNCQ